MKSLNGELVMIFLVCGYGLIGRQRTKAILDSGIAPGAFPSDMQMIIANAPIGSISEVARKQSQELRVDAEKV